MERLLPELELVELPLGQALFEAGGSRRYAYFPTTAIIYLQYLLESGSSTDLAMVGREGFVGVPIILGGRASPSTGVVQSAGRAYRLQADVLTDAFNRTGDFRDVLLRYTQAYITQIAQSAVCNRHHTLAQRMCRWLLMWLDRVDGNRFFLTQELISNMLGVRREGVTEVASKLQRQGAIRYCRGHLEVLSRHRLEAGACECYAVVRDEAHRLFPGPRGHRPSGVTA